MEVWAPGVVPTKLTRYSNISETIPTNNYWAPLTEQVEDSDPKEILNDIIHDKSNQAVFDTAATSSAEKPGDNFIPTKERSDKIFNQPSGAKMEATYVHKLKHKVRDPAGRVDIVPDLVEDSLISGPKFAEAGYVTLLTPKELLIFDGDDLKVSVSKKAVIHGWRDPGSKGMWRIPLEPYKHPMKSEYILLNKEQEESVKSVYELPSTKEIVRYLHACAGFPTKTTWLRAIKAGNYATWPHLTAKAVRKHFPESDETAKGHMKNVKQGIRSTKRRAQGNT